MSLFTFCGATYCLTLSPKQLVRYLTSVTAVTSLLASEECPPFLQISWKETLLFPGTVHHEGFGLAITLSGREEFFLQLFFPSDCSVYRDIQPTEEIFNFHT